MPFCIRCGNKISDLAVACPKCGTPNAVRPQGSQAVTGPAVPAAYGNAPPLRPLSVGEIIDVAIKLYRAHWRTLLKLVAIVVVPVQIISALILSSVTPEAGTFPATTPLEPGTTPEIDMSAIWTFVVGIGATSLLGLLATQLATAASLKAVSDGYLSEEPDWRRSLEFAFRRFGSLIWLALLSGFFIGIGFLLCIVPGVYLAVAWSIAVPILLIENTRGYGALQRSQQLIKGRWWPVLGVLALGRILASVLGFVFGGAASLLSFTSESEVVLFATNAVSTAISQTLVTPFLAATIAILYFDLRVRKEGFDLELLAQHVGVAPGSGDVGGPAAGTPFSPDEPVTPKPSPRARKPAARKPAAPRARKAAPSKPVPDEPVPKPEARKPKAAPPRRKPVRPGYKPPEDGGPKKKPPSGG